ncbi:hypothetical protein N0V90_003134 [Kalmusia sp. IMI 367209]|nr:hypothetical protein N0V90_003134 [Kalmusia sp. IMI 367209]
MSTVSSSQQLPAIREAIQGLLQAFESHPQFPAQQSQRKGKIYFMHDFASRTNAMFGSLLNNTPPPDTPATRGTIPNVVPSSMTDKQRKELESDAFGRCTMLHTLIYDTTGMAGMMFGEAPGQGVDVGDAVRKAADGVNAVTSDGQWGTA